jgi:hypothetical protein
LIYNQGKMPRSRMRNQQILIRLSIEEKEKAMYHAEGLGLSLSAFIRLLVNTYTGPETPPPRKKREKILKWK